MGDVSLLQSLLAALRARARRVHWGRGSRRFAVSSPASMRAADTVGAKWHSVLLDDLSIGGARVACALELARRSVIDLKLPLGPAGEIPVRALVVRVRGDRRDQTREYGLRFIDLSYDRYRVLIEYINEREGAHASAQGSRHNSKRA